MLKKTTVYLFVCFLFFSCSKNKITCEVTYTDSSKDTITIRTIDPEPYISKGDLRTTHDSRAIVSGVRAYKVLKITK